MFDAFCNQELINVVLVPSLGFVVLINLIVADGVIWEHIDCVKLGSFEIIFAIVNWILTTLFLNLDVLLLLDHFKIHTLFWREHFILVVSLHQLEVFSPGSHSVCFNISSFDFISRHWIRTSFKTTCLRVDKTVIN
jgi:hypothetical protein